jgi:hypothetical protein
LRYVRGLYQEVVVDTHQTVIMGPDFRKPPDLFKQVQKSLVVCFIEKNPRARKPSVHDMVIGTLIFHPQWPRHAHTLAVESTAGLTLNPPLKYGLPSSGVLDAGVLQR